MTSENRVIVRIRKARRLSFCDRKIQNGTMAYIKNSAEMPKNSTLRRQTKPPMLPKFKISVL